MLARYDAWVASGARSRQRSAPTKRARLAPTTDNDGEIDSEAETEDVDEDDVVKVEYLDWNFSYHLPINVQDAAALLGRLDSPCCVSFYPSSVAVRPDNPHRLEIYKKCELDVNDAQFVAAALECFRRGRFTRLDVDDAKRFSGLLAALAELPIEVRASRVNSRVLEALPPAVKWVRLGMENGIIRRQLLGGFAKRFASLRWLTMDVHSADGVASLEFPAGLQSLSIHGEMKAEHVAALRLPAHLQTLTLDLVGDDAVERLKLPPELRELELELDTACTKRGVLCIAHAAMLHPTLALLGVDVQGNKVSDAFIRHALRNAFARRAVGVLAQPKAAAATPLTRFLGRDGDGAVLSRVLGRLLTK